jgi:hypothetical protein
MNADQWRNNRLITPQGGQYVTVSATQKGDISVGNDIFQIDGTQPNFCLVAIVNDSTSETIPANFTTYNDFVLWVHRNTAVTVRNFSVLNSGTRNDYEILYLIENPESDIRIGAIEVKARNLPNGTTFGIKCQILRMDKSSVYNSSDPTSAQIAEAGNIPPNFSNYVQIYGRLPSGGTWPENAELETSFYINSVGNKNELMYEFGVEPDTVLKDVNSLNSIGAPGRLVRVGNCSTIFKLG